MTQKVGRQSHRGVYRKTDEISTNAAAAIAKWRFVTEIQRQTACVKFTRDGRTFYWHPVAKKFRREGEAAWSHLPSGRGVVALMLHLHGKEELLGIPHFGAMLDPPAQHVSFNCMGGTRLDPPSAMALEAVGIAPQAVRARDVLAGESPTVSPARAEISRVAPREMDSATEEFYASIDAQAHANNEAFERLQRQHLGAGGPPQSDDYDADDPMTYEDGGAHWGSDS